LEHLDHIDSTTNTTEEIVKAAAEETLSLPELCGSLDAQLRPGCLVYVETMISLTSQTNKLLTHRTNGTVGIQDTICRNTLLYTPQAYVAQQSIYENALSLQRTYRATTHYHITQSGRISLSQLSPDIGISTMQVNRYRHGHKLKTEMPCLSYDHRGEALTMPITERDIGPVASAVRL
jgi:hypothetical protein